MRIGDLLQFRVLQNRAARRAQRRLSKRRRRRSHQLTNNDQTRCLEALEQRILLSTFDVTKTADTADGSCSLTDCSLREAIIAANVNGTGQDTINVPAGIYTLTIANTSGDEDSAAEGDLDINSNLILDGVGAGSTIIQAGASAAAGIDRVFHVDADVTAAITVSLEDITVQHGNVGSSIGGGINVDFHNDSTLTLTRVTVDDNTTTGFGGGIGSAGGTTLNIIDSTISNNTAGTDGSGNTGGIHCAGCTLDMDNSTVSGNIAGNGAASSDAGGIQISGNGGPHTIDNSTITNNTADDIGGGIQYTSLDSHRGR